MSEERDDLLTKSELWAEGRIEELEVENQRLEECVDLLNGRIKQLLEDDIKLFRALLSVRTIADTLIKEQGGV